MVRREQGRNEEGRQGQAAKNPPPAPRGLYLTLELHDLQVVAWGCSVRNGTVWFASQDCSSPQEP